MLAITPVERRIEFRFRRLASMSGNSRQKERRRSRVLLIVLAKQLVERQRFDAHHGNIDAQKERGKNESEYQPAGGDSESQSDHKAAEIEGIACVSVRAGGGQRVILSQVPRGPGAQRETRQRDQAAGDERRWPGLCQEKENRRAGKAQRHAPSLHPCSASSQSSQVPPPRYFLRDANDPLRRAARAQRRCPCKSISST